MATFQNYQATFPKSIYAAIERVGHDEDFEPQYIAKPTDVPPGTHEKVEVMRRRVEQGQPVFHPGDLSELDDVDGKAWGLGASHSSLMSSYETREIKRLRGARGRRETD